MPRLLSTKRIDASWQICHHGSLVCNCPVSLIVRRCSVSVAQVPVIAHGSSTHHEVLNKKKTCNGVATQHLLATACLEQRSVCICVMQHNQGVRASCSLVIKLNDQWHAKLKTFTWSTQLQLSIFLM